MRQKQQQDASDIFNETRKFGYFFGIYKGNQYSRMTFYNTYKCLNGDMRITYYGHINNEKDVIKFMQDDFVVRLCDKLASSTNLKEVQSVLSRYMDNFVTEEKIKSSGSLMFYIQDYIILMSVNQNIIETKILGPKAPIKIGTPLTRGKIKYKGFHKSQLPAQKTYNIVLGSSGFWKVNRPGMIESVWGLMTGNSNFEELIGISDEQERRRICQRLVKDATRQAPKEDVALIYAELCREE
jgi:hypothetical protein